MNVMKYVPNVVSSTIARQVLLTQKNSPTLLFGAGVIGVVATVVLASKATLNLETTLEKNVSLLEIAKNKHENDHQNYSDQDYKQDVVVLYTRTAGSIAKLYGPAFVVGVVSIASLAGSHHILTTRNAGLVAAYAAVERGFAEYRQRVLNEVGPEKEREFRYGSETNQVVDSKTGKKAKAITVGKDGESIYARYFDQKSSSWSPEFDYNMVFLRVQQTYLNDMLHARGHMFLNEVYDRLGLERSPEGQLVGWVMNRGGDNYVDIGIDDTNLNFVTHQDGSILLDFNVDGVVYELI